MPSMPMPTDEAFRAESARFLPLCAAHCHCPNGWHFMWSAYKASGRRRSIYYQQPLLQTLLAPALPDVRKVLIAGAADAGILSVLASILGAQVEYVAIDICGAPLEDIREHALRKGLVVRCQQTPLQDFVPQERFDLVFVHNTLYFMPPADALRALRQLRLGMHANAWMACGMRYNREVAAPCAADMASKTRAMLAATYADRPDLIGLIEPHVDAQAQALAQAGGGLHRYQPAEFASLLKEALYTTVGGYIDTLTPPGTLNHLPIPAEVVSEVVLLRLRP